MAVGIWWCRELCRCDRQYLRRYMRELIWLLDWIVQWNLYTMGASTIYYSPYTSTFVPTSHPLTVPSAHESGTRFTTPTTLTVVRSRPRSSCDPVAQHIAAEPRLRLSSSVYHELTAVYSSVLPPRRWRSGWPPRPRPHRRSSSAVQPRHVSSRLNFPSDHLL